MNGSGMPVVGRVTVTAAILITAWAVIQVVMPQASRDPNRSGARSAIRYPRYVKRANRASTAVVPSSPVSSPTMAKIKSVCANGSH